MKMFLKISSYLNDARTFIFKFLVTVNKNSSTNLQPPSDDINCVNCTVFKCPDKDFSNHRIPVYGAKKIVPKIIVVSE